MKQRKYLDDLVIERKVIANEQSNQSFKKQQTSEKKLMENLMDDNPIKEKQTIEMLELQFGIFSIDLKNFFIDSEIPKLISENLAKRHILIPFKKDSEKLFVAMADPMNIFAIDDVQLATGLEVKPFIAKKQDIMNAIDQYYGKEIAEKAVADFRKQYNMEKLSSGLDEKIADNINNAPVVRLINSVIRQAVKTKASDIHIEPFEKSIRIRFRIDGELQEIMSSEKTTHTAIVTRIKIMGKMDIAEKRVPQDGHVEINVDGKLIDMRISTLPTVNGEKIVIRLLYRSNFLLSKNQLGFSNANLEVFNKIIKIPSGIIIVTGPTGSGKTTTMYTIIRELNLVEKNIITIEDPVEYKLKGINQVQVNPKANLTFANALRAILRQDPNIIMIGEIRDSETAHIAIRAAITGHLVLSTMHTNDSPSTIMRLIDMGIEPYLVSSAVVGIISQRLVRKICPKCKEPYQPDITEKKLFDITGDSFIYKGKGCHYCNHTGYKGRTAVHEIMAVTEELRFHIDRHDSIDILRQKAIKQGMVPLKKACIQLVTSGITTIEEWLKTTYVLE